MSAPRAKLLLLWTLLPCATTAPLRAATYPLVEFPQLRGVVGRDVVQDTSGRIWLATDQGLWRWASDEVVTQVHRIRTADTTECLIEHHGVLWTGTDSGLVGVDLMSMSQVAGPAPLRGLRIHQMVPDLDGRTWCATAGGLYRLTLDASPPAAELIAETDTLEVFALTTTPSGEVWGGICGAVFCFDGVSVIRFFEDFLAGREIRSLVTDRRGMLWIGAREPGALYRVAAPSDEWDRRVPIQVLPRADEPGPEINAMIPYSDHEMLFGAERGLYRWTGQDFVLIDHRTGLAHAAVLALCVDREGLVWIATRGGGVYLLRSPHILTYDIDDGLPHPVVQTILPLSEDEFIVGTAAGLCRMNRAGSITRRFEHLHSVAAACVDGTGRLWVGGPNGLACFDLHRGERVALQGIASIRDVTAIGADGRGSLWVCTASTGLWAVDADTASQVPLPADAPVDHLHLGDIHTGPDGAVFLGTATGILRRDLNGSWRKLHSGREVRSLATDTGGGFAARPVGLWIGTSQGLMTLEGEFCRPFARRGSPHGNVNDIAVDAEGGIWLATPEGALRYDGHRFATFNHTDGLPADDVRCVTMLRPGVLLAGTTAGLALIDTDRITANMAAPRVAVTTFQAGGEQYVIRSDRIQVPNWQRNISISFEGVGFRQDPRRLRYLSRLIGFDEWSAPSAEPSRTYTNLPPGAYEFQVRAINAQGRTGEQVATVAFSVAPPLWLTPWFLAACTVATVALGSWVLATQRKKRQLQRAAQAATLAKSEFLAKVSHEIRTPLTVILGCAERLDHRPGASAGSAEAVGAIHRNSNHLLDLINDLLDLSKIEAGRLSIHPVPASVPEILRDVDAIMRVGAEQHGLDFQIVCETSIPEQIITDPGRLRQALINLVSNAIKFTPEGLIRIRVRCDGRDQDRRLVFAVEDTGVGIPAEKIDMIFDTFSQVESAATRRFTGTGLGLAIAKSVGERLFGTLTVESEVGRGSCFSLSIDLAKAGLESRGMTTRMVAPADLPATRRDPRGAAPDTGLPTLHGHLLLAEDAVDISNMMRVQLASAGATIDAVDNGPDALNRASSTPYDVIIVDIHMPGMDGIDVIREIRARGNRAPIVVTSADSSEERRRECALAGADGFVPKPFTQAALLEEVRRVIPDTAPSTDQTPPPPIRCELDLRSPGVAAAVARFAGSLVERVDRMDAALTDYDGETLASLAHQLKGAGGINGYTCVSEQAACLEASLAREDRSAVAADLHRLRRTAEAIRQGLTMECSATGRNGAN